MNILFFITPKSEIAYIYEDDSIRQALEKMEYHKFSAVPLLTRDGRYCGTITEGDLLWGIKNQYDLNLKEAEGIPVNTIRRRMDYRPVTAKSNMEDMIDRALNQNLSLIHISSNRSLRPLDQNTESSLAISGRPWQRSTETKLWIR